MASDRFTKVHDPSVGTECGASCLWDGELDEWLSGDGPGALQSTGPTEPAKRASNRTVFVTESAPPCSHLGTTE